MKELTKLQQFFMNNAWKILELIVLIAVSWTIFGSRLTAVELQVFDIKTAHAESLEKMSSNVDDRDAEMQELVYVVQQVLLRVEAIETKVDLLLDGKLIIE